MDRFVQFALWVSVASLIASICASLMGKLDLAVWLGSPAVFFSGWRFFGHVVTLDDDFPGGWSNPDGEKEILSRSLRLLGASALIFVFVLTVVFAWQF